MSSSSSFAGDPNQLLGQQVILPHNYEELLVRLRQYINNMHRSIDARDSAHYFEVESLCGQKYFPTFVSGQSASAEGRDVIRKVVQTGTLSTGANTIAHGVTFPTPNTYYFTRIYGVIADSPTTTYAPIPNDVTAVTVDTTNINVTIPAGFNGYAGHVVLEWTPIT